MKWLPLVALILVVLLTALPALAERPMVSSATPAYSGTISPGELTPTPEMWFYEQYMRQYQDPKMAVRQRAEFRANQRDARLAARRWFGLSNARPLASNDPINDASAPHWTSPNALHPEQWSGTSPVIVTAPASR